MKVPVSENHLLKKFDDVRDQLKAANAEIEALKETNQLKERKIRVIVSRNVHLQRRILELGKAFPFQNFSIFLNPFFCGKFNNNMVIFQPFI